MSTDSFDDWLTANHNMTLSFLHGARPSVRPSYVLSLLLATAGLIANCGSLAALGALRRRRRRRPTAAAPDTRLLASIALSDLLVCVAVLGRAAVPLNPYGRHDADLAHSCAYMVLRCVQVSAHLATLLALLAIATDHYSAVTRPLRHAARHTATRSRRLVAAIWTAALAAGFSDFAVPPPVAPPCGADTNYCAAVHCSAYDSEYVMLGVAVAMLLALVPMYTRVYTAARLRRRRRRRPTLVAALIVIAFALCWLPYCLFQLAITLAMALDAPRTSTYFATTVRVEAYLYALVIANALADASIYALRLRSVRRGYRTLVALHCARFMRAGHAHTLDTSSDSGRAHQVEPLAQLAVNVNTIEKTTVL